MRKATLPRLHVAGVAVFAAIVAACGASAQDTPVVKQQPSPQTKEIKRDVPYVPTPQNVVDEMLTLANVTKDDVVYDLGCGDGRLVITAPRPPRNPMPAASPRKIASTSRLVAPTAFIKPISRVRSRIDIAIVLAIPMAATRRAIAPTPPKMNCRIT